MKKTFKIEFLNFEEKLKNNEKREDYNIVFLDDLDRCEPENVLNLLSALKLFFTYGKKTIFFCGIDKKAVNEAVRTKYKEIVKVNEYLEKIFDISFSMPKTEGLTPLVSQFFDSRDIKIGQDNFKLDAKINEFFREIDFLNPRKVKKILNKYSILENFKLLETENTSTNLPNFICSKGNQNGNFLETILTLYFLILQEFFREKYRLFFNPEEKQVYFIKAIEANYKGVSGSDLNRQKDTIKKYIESSLLELPLSKFGDINFTNQQQREDSTDKFIGLFSPSDVDFLRNGSFKRLESFKTHFITQKKEIDYFMTIYLLKNINHLLFKDNSLSDFELKNFQKIHNDYL